jgi:hypothetical protein
MSVQQNLLEMERQREWRAIAVRHCFHVLPGESILELGAVIPEAGGATGSKR